MRSAYDKSQRRKKARQLLAGQITTEMFYLARPRSGWLGSAQADVKKPALGGPGASAPGQ